VENTTEYRLIESIEKLAGQNLKLQKSTFFPDLAAVYMHHEELNKEAFSFTPPDLVAVSMSIPIFSSGMRNAKVNQAKINYEKAGSVKWQASQGLILQFEETKAALSNAIDKYTTQKENLALANKVLNRALIRYQQGTISGMELSQTQNQFFTAQTEYFTSIVQLINSYNKMTRMLKNIQ
jgi:outer membrane protein TolC